MTTFTDKHKTAIRKYLGYPASLQGKANVAAGCTRVEALGADEVLACLETLDEIDKIDKQIKNARGFAGQSFSSNASGTQQFIPGERLGSLRNEGGRYISELASTLQLLVMREYFGVDKWKTSASVRA